MSRLHSLWQSYGWLITLAGSILIAVASGAYWLSGRIASLDKALEGLDENRITLRQIETDLKVLRSEELTRIGQKLARFELELQVANGKISTDVGKDRVAAVDDMLAELRSEHQGWLTRVSELQVQLAGIPGLKENFDRLYSEQVSLRDSYDAELKKIIGEISEVKEGIGRINGILEIIKPLATEGLALGRIKRDELSKIYTEVEIEELLEDAKALFRPRNGGGGGGGVLGRYAYGSVTMGGDCDGVPENCAYYVINLPGEDRFSRSQATVEVFFGLDESELALLVPSEDQEEALASAQDFEGRLCKWVSERLAGKLSSAEAS